MIGTRLKLFPVVTIVFVAIAISGFGSGDASWKGEINGEYKLRASGGGDAQALHYNG